MDVSSSLVYRDPKAALDWLERAFGFERDAGADIVVELTDTDYGSRDYDARDPEGNVWSFGTYRPSRP